MKRVLLLSAAALMMTACAESTTAPTAAKHTPSARASHDDDFFCASGYVIAYDENGNPYCIPDPNGGGDQLRGGSPPAAQTGPRVLPPKP